MSPIILACLCPKRHQSQKRRSFAFGDDVVRVLRLLAGNVDTFAGLSGNGAIDYETFAKLRVCQKLLHVEPA